MFPFQESRSPLHGSPAFQVDQNRWCIEKNGNDQHDVLRLFARDGDRDWEISKGIDSGARVCVTDL